MSPLTEAERREEDARHPIRRFARIYIKPFWFRMALVMGMAGVTSSYMFILGFITKLTVDHVLQIRPAVVMGPVGGSSGLLGQIARRGEAPAVAQDAPVRHDPQSAHTSRDAPPRQKSKTEQVRWLWIIFISYLIVRSIFSGINWLYTYNISFVGQRIVFRVRMDLHQKVQKLQMTFFDRQQTGKIMSRILDDVGMLQHEITTTFVETVRNVVRILLGTIVLLTINVELALLALTALPVYVVTYKVFRGPLVATFLRMRETYAETYGIMEERIRGIRVVLSFARERGEFRAFFVRVASILRLSIKSSMLNAGLGAGCSTVSAVATALVFYYGALAVRSGEITIGSLVYFSMSLGHLFMPLIRLTHMNAVIQQMLVVISRVFEVLDEEVMILDRPGAVSLHDIRGRVLFRNVCFRYHETADAVVKDLDFVVRPGTSVAVVGPSGSGKSTLLSLLLRLYEPTEGSILLDDYDIRDVKISSLRAHIGMVPQEPVLFSGSIAENIVYGRGEASPARIMQAAERAELHEFIMTLPEKYEARVGERGSNLSGGQKQRLAFAMALLTNPSILILDDTTSALDAQTEARIQETLSRIMKDRTTFVITHRISTAMRASRILVLDNGRMAGWGTHEELLLKEGVYRQLYEQQQQKDAEDEFFSSIEEEEETTP